MDFVARFKSLPSPTKRLLGFGILLALVVGLPLFVWAIVTQRFLIIKRAATGEPGICVAQNKTITVTPISDTGGTCHDIQMAVNAVTGSGFTVLIQPGTYNPPTTINGKDKVNLTITGSPPAGNDAAITNFVPGGWGFLVQNSSGSIQWLTILGGSSNGMLSIRDSTNFNLGYININSQTSHTIDIGDSSNVSVYNTEIQSSAGALEVNGSSAIRIMNNKIHNSANALSLNGSSDIEITGNLIYQNSEAAIRLSGNQQNLLVTHNSMLYNGAGNGFPTLLISGTYSLLDFENNIIAFGAGPGISVSSTSSQDSIQLKYNDVYNNPHPNYVGIRDYTGTNGNISRDPMINTTPGYAYCLLKGSPAIYGDVGKGEYMGYIGPCGTSPTPSMPPFPSISPSIPPSPSISPTPTPSPTVRPFQIKFKFGGVSDGSAEGAKVVARFRGGPEGNTVDYVTPPLPAYYLGDGIYRLVFGTISTYLPIANNYTISLKGEKHVGIKFCAPSGQTTHCSQTGEPGRISIPDNSGSIIYLDFTGIPLDPGDLPPQDGVANANDFAKITALLTKPCADLTANDKATADLDYNGCVNIRDAFLMRKTLESRYDEY